MAITQEAGNQEVETLAQSAVTSDVQQNPDASPAPQEEVAVPQTEAEKEAALAEKYQKYLKKGDLDGALKKAEADKDDAGYNFLWAKQPLEKRYKEYLDNNDLGGALEMAVYQSDVAGAQFILNKKPLLSDVDRNFLLAATRGEAPLVKLFVKNDDANINAQDELMDYTLLQDGIRSTNPKVVDFILSKHPYMDTKDKDGNNALHTAIKVASYENLERKDQKGEKLPEAINQDNVNEIHILRSVLNAGGDTLINIPDGNGSLPIHIAFETLNNMDEKVNLIASTPGVNLDALGPDGDTVLMQVCSSYQPLARKYAEYLLYKGAKIDATDKEGHAVLENILKTYPPGTQPSDLPEDSIGGFLYGVQIGRIRPTNTLSYLDDVPPAPEMKEKTVQSSPAAIAASPTSFVKKDALYDAIATRDTKEVARLLDANPALVNQHYAPDGCNLDMTPLMVAAQNNDPAMIKLLAAKGAKLDDTQEGILWTAVHIAAEEGNLDALKALKEVGADLDALDSSGWTAYKRAADRNDNLLMAALLALGAARDKAPQEQQINDHAALTPLSVPYHQQIISQSVAINS